MFKKLILMFVVVLILGVVAIGFFFSSLVNTSIVEGVNRFGPKLTQTKVTLDSADISLLGGTGSLEGLFIGNPEGFTGERAFELGEISVALDLGSIRSDTIVVKKIHIKNPAVSFEQTRRGSNLQAIQKNIEEATGAGRNEPTASEPTESGDASESASQPAKKIIIEDLVVEGGVVDVVFLGQRLTVPMPPLEMKDIGKSEGGIDQAKAAALFMTEMVNGIVNSVTNQASNVSNVGNEVGKQVKGVKDEAEKALGNLKKLF